MRAGGEGALRWRRTLPAALVTLALGVAPGVSGTAVAGEEPVPALKIAPAGVPAAALERARGAADDLGARLRSLLAAEVSRGGAVGAVEACAAQAQDATREEAARHGVSLRRVSLQQRNPADAPDAFERAALERFATQVQQGNPPAELAEVASDAMGASELRYLRPILLTPNCLGCHGKVAELAPGIAAVLAQRYPGDLAVGYASGDLRGAFSVRVPLPADRPVVAAPKVP